MKSRISIFSSLLLCVVCLLAVTDATAGHLRHPTAGMLLIANEEMSDPRFKQSVILLIEHNNTGSWGVIINRPADISIAEALPELQTSNQSPIYFGGPVQLDHLVFLIQSEQQDNIDTVISGVAMSFELQQLADHLAKGSDVRVYAGYAGWGAGQLDFELSVGGWSLYQGKSTHVFDRNPQTLWQRLIRSLSAVEI